MAKVFSFAKFDPRKRERYLGCISAGMTFTKAARSVGVSRDLVNEYIKQHPEFKAARDEAEADACEVVEGYLMEACKNMNLTAIIFWLLNRSNGRWEDKRNTRQVEVKQDTDPFTKAVVGQWLDMAKKEKEKRETPK